MVDSPSSISKPQETISQFDPTFGNNSWAIGMRKEHQVKEQWSYTDRASNPQSNSWARLDEKVNLIKKEAAKPTDASGPTSRGTYGNKPLPSIPELPPLPYTPRLTPHKTQAHRTHPSFPRAFSSLNFVARLKKHASVEPDRLLADLGRTQPDVKPRRVTDPVIPDLWFPRKSEESLQCQEESTAAANAAIGPGKNCPKISAQPSFANENKVAQILDANPPSDEKHTQLPLFDSPSEISSSPMTISISDNPNSPVNLVRELAFETDPTIRHVLEDKLAALTVSSRRRNKSAILREGGVRKPRRAGTLSETRRVHFAATYEIRRHLSEPKVIEHELRMNNKQGENEGGTIITRPGHSPTERSEKTIASYESNNSEGNESNKINVNVRSIPCLPTSVPQHIKHCSKTQAHHRSQRLVAAMPMIDESELDMSPQLQPASPRVWCNADSHGNSFTSPSLHPSLIVAPLFASQDRINAVPPPPASSHPDYRPMRPTPADLAQLELNLHHHIDSGFSSLTKLLSDKTDRMLDQLIRQLENLENKVEKDIKNMESQVTELKAEHANLSQENKAILKEVVMMKDSVRGLDLKLELISGGIEEIRSRDHYRQSTPSGSESQDPDLAQTVARRSQEPIAHESQGSDQAGQAQISFHGSQGNRSGLVSAGRSVMSNQSVLAQTEGTNRQPPDLKDHPAFASAQSGHSLTFNGIAIEESGSVVKGMLPLFQTPSFRDGGWYKQAYGQ